MRELFSDFKRFASNCNNSSSRWSKIIPKLQANWPTWTHKVESHGRYQEWLKAFQSLPNSTADFKVQHATPSLTFHDEPNYHQLQKSLLSFAPWRKGPFAFGELEIDAEWRCDLKYERLKKILPSSLAGSYILDVGCGNGYYLWRLLETQATKIVGIEPTVHYLFQYQAFASYANIDRITILPTNIELFPKNTQLFDWVLSMGVLYHAKSPFEHLSLLHQALKPGGKLVLETLVIEEGQILVPLNRYAAMKNVWFIPSVPELIHWLKRMKFHNIEVKDISWTTPQEQRVTPWTGDASLKDFLDTINPKKTVEGYPAPLRAMIVAEK